MADMPTHVDGAIHSQQNERNLCMVWLFEHGALGCDIVLSCVDVIVKYTSLSSTPAACTAAVPAPAIVVAAVLATDQQHRPCQWRSLCCNAENASVH
jgi:hypothetical protein